MKKFAVIVAIVAALVGTATRSLPTDDKAVASKDNKTVQIAAIEPEPWSAHSIEPEPW